MRQPPQVTRRVTRRAASAARPSSAVHRVRASLPVVLQCAAAAGAAWWVGVHLLGHAQPVFAASAAVIVLAAGAGGRARQAVDLLAGVLAGLLVGQVVRSLGVEPGAVQTALAVLAALLVASLLDPRPLAFIQGGSSALFVLTLPVAQGPGVRLLDAAVGGAIGLLGSQVLFSPDPVRLLAGPLRGALGEVAAALGSAVTAARTPDRQEARRAADEALARVRAAVAELGDLAAARTTSRAVASRTLRGRRRAAPLGALEEHLDEVEVLVAAALVALSGVHRLVGAGGAPDARLADDLAAVGGDVAALAAGPLDGGGVRAATAALVRLTGRR